jgi:hypothetical protein
MMIRPRRVFPVRNWLKRPGRTFMLTIMQPLFLEKGVQLGNSDAMGYLSFCYFYGYGVPVDRGRAMQLMRTLTMTAQRRAIRIDKEQQEERERAAREFARQLSENAESRTAFSSTDRPTPKPKKTPGMFVITPYGIKLRNSFNTIWDNNGQTSP